MPQNNVSTPNLDYNDMLPAWQINDALMGGTLEMRRQRENFLPKWPKEHPDDYEQRLSVATLLPGYEETIRQDTGRVFAEPIQLGDTVPEEIREYAEDIDLEGTRLDVWAQQFFSIGLQYGVAYALVDFPRIDDDSKPVTVAQQKESGARPYATMINPRQIIGWQTSFINGKVVLTDLRILETVTIDQDFCTQIRIEQVRHLTPGKVEIWRESAEGGNVDKTWVIHDEWFTTRDDIPLVAFYTKKTGFMRASPPLLNLANLNIKHWQSQSEQDNILHVARVPILSVYGLGEGQELTIGSSSAITFTNRETQGVEYTEHTGSAIGAGKTSLDDLEDQMRMAGAKLLRAQNTSTKSVDQTTQEVMQENSPLFTMSASLEDAIDNIFQIMAEWIGLPDGGKVDVRTELDVQSVTLDSTAATTVMNLHQSGEIRAIDAVRTLQQLRFIDPDAKPEEVIDELSNPGGLTLLGNQPPVTTEPPEQIPPENEPDNGGGDEQ